MAIYRLSLSTVSRGAGRSAAAAYRGGVRLHDARTGLTHDFTRRGGVVSKALIGWQGTRQALWEAAEAAERRRDSVVAREVQVALPHELTAPSRWRVTVRLAKWLSARHGVAVDVALHAPGKSGDLRNHHAHLLFTTRTVDAAGRFGTKTTVLDQRRKGSAELHTMRETWAAFLNAALHYEGRSVRVDHRSYARQGLAAESVSITRGARELERRGTVTDRGDVQRRTSRRPPPVAAPAPALASTRRGSQRRRRR
jgi:hypothetical protein